MPTLLVHGDSNSQANYTGDGGNWAQAVATALGCTLANWATHGIYSTAVRADLPNMIIADPDLALIMIGTNDVAGGLDNHQAHVPVLATYLDNMRAVLDGLQGASVPVVLMTPPFSLKPQAAYRLADYARELSRLCAEHRIPCIDLVSYMAAQPDATLGTYFYGVDPYHLSHVGHDMVADTVTRMLNTWTPPVHIDTVPIAFDHCTVGGYQVSTFDHPCNGDLLFVATTNTSGTITSVQYSGIGLTEMGAGVPDGYGYTTRLWGLVRPPTGTHSVVIAGASGNFCAQALSYSGYTRSTLPTLMHTTAGGGGNMRTEFLTVTTPGTWLLMITRNNATTASAGSGTTRRGVSSLLFESFDSAGPVAVGTQSLSAVASGATAWASILVAVVPS